MKKKTLTIIIALACAVVLALGCFAVQALTLSGRNAADVALNDVDPFEQNREIRFSEETREDIIRACFAMGKVKTGALIVVEQAIRLTEYESTGIQMDCLVSSQVLINIFEHNTPLHDGAIIVRGDRIVSATCYLPLSDNMGISKDLGTRHRAAVGMSEVSDALVITVSEETGAVSLAVEGTLYRNIDANFLKSKLRFAAKLSKDTEPYLTKLKRRLKHVAQTDKADYK